MGRPEKPIVTDNRALRALAQWLREQRRRAGLSYRDLALRAGVHATTLQRTASAESVPTLPAVRAYARACDASPEDAKLLWKRARYEATRSARSGRASPAPSPVLVRDFADLSAGLRELYEKAGSPSLRTMEERGGEYGALPRSTAHRIVNRQAMPHNPAQFQAFLRACEVPDADRRAWEDAWSRAWRHHKQTEGDTTDTPHPPQDGSATNLAPLATPDTLTPVGLPRRVRQKSLYGVRTAAWPEAIEVRFAPPRTRPTPRPPQPARNAG
ncbi:helix-turn-helix domain-containing protein [Streptomyces sp. NBC_01716]|uniref:helix-turn-helix domain-containing protein n=1 Tax=Streptomyces sp. NBC_01716 TaxID=2975917 RepID=UPI002E31E201|nr:helix-turn-helix transcriptional regulator [Streptomyces sp. NBC_01716]